jgi:O-antigen ligase
MVFILARPQEFLPLLQRVPFLHLFTVLAVLGYVIDVRLRRLQPIAPPTLPWLLALVVWAIVGTAIVAPNQVMGRVLELTSLFCLYGTIASGVQRLRTFQLVAGVMAATCFFITAVCFHQGIGAKQCVGGQESEGEITGHPDGRRCEINDNCRGPDAEPGMEYRCEHVGLFGTYSVEERVRYRGELHDPNEVALTICAGSLSLLIGFTLRKKRRPFTAFLCALGAAITFYTVFMTQSRGGLVAGMLVPGVYMIRKYGFKAIFPALLVAVPVIALNGRSGEAADVSNQGRYDAWATGLEMFKHSPIFGVGARQFTEHHYLTAHNSFVLTLAELGFPGMVMFVAIVYLTFKCLLTGLREIRDIPEAEAANVWGMSLLASMGGIVFQINTLSFAYHSVLWIFFGLVGAWTGAIRYHRPDFRVKMTWKDIIIVTLVCATYVVIVLPIFLKLKGAS